MSSVLRWSGSLRLVHWGFAVPFLGLLATGFLLGVPELRGIPFMGSKLVREIHLTFAVLLVVLPALAASWDGYRSAARVGRDALAFDRTDAAWVTAWPRRALGRGARDTAVGRFNAGQKVNAWLVLALSTGLAVSGSVIAPEAGRPVPQAIRITAYEFHVLLAVATIPLVAGHVFLAVLFPPTRPSLRGILFGRVPTRWARAHHRAWLDEVLRTERSSPEPRGSRGSLD